MKKYQVIYKELQEKIESGQIKANTYLKSENELMKIYEVSRDTIRKVLDLLAQNGYIQKNKGKGSLVLDINQIVFPIGGLTSFKEIEGIIHKESETILHCFNQIEPNDYLKKSLNLRDDSVYHIERIRKIDGERIILDVDYLNASIIHGLNQKHAQDSLYEYIENTLGLNIGFARKEITVAKASVEEKELLDMIDYDLLVCVKSFTYLDDGRIIQYTISKHRPDKFRFVDFARRTKL